MTPIYSDLVKCLRELRQLYEVSPSVFRCTTWEWKEVPKCNGMLVSEQQQYFSYIIIWNAQGVPQ